jgi:hypothetical protein
MVCTSAAGTTNVQINAAPATPNPSNNGALCEGQTLNLSANVSADSYQWNGPNGYSSTSQNPTRNNVTTAMDGNYTLTITNNGCTSAAGTTNVQINAAPATPNPSNNGALCEGQTLNLSANVSADSYQWNGPNGYSSTSQNPTRNNVTTAMDGNYTLTITNNGCTSAAGTTNVQINAAPATPNPSNNGALCEGQTLNLSANVSADSYQWNGPNGYSSTSQNPTRNNVTTAMDGNYTLTITNNGCTSAAGTTNVQINAAPATPNPSNNGALCEGQTLNLSANVSADSYQWNGPNGYSSTSQNPTRNNVTTAMDGNYTLTITNNGCTSAAGTTNVQINAAPTTPNPSNNGPLCAGQTLNLSANVSADSYSWTGPNGYTSSNQNPTRNNVTTAMDGNYSLTITNNGCTSAAGTTNVQINAAPATPNPSNNGALCEGQTLNLSANVSADSYQWNGPNGYSSNSQNPTRNNVTTAMDGNYTLTITNNGCTSAAGTTNVQINAAPATPNPSNNGPLCAGQTLNLSANVNADSYQWNGPNGYSSTNQNPTRTNVTTAMDGNYTLTITENGCTSAAGTTNVQINAAPATPNPSNNGPLCAGQTLNLSANVSADSYQWNGPNGYSSTNQNPTRTNVTTAMDGDYTLTITQNGCTSAAGTTNVQINAAPATPNPSNNGPLCAGQTLNFSANVTADSYQWNGPNGYSSTNQNPTRTNVTTAMDGDYTLTITQNGCTSAAGTTNVQINAAPATPNPSNNGPLCAGQTLNLSANVTADSYQWNGPNGYSSTNQNPTRTNVTTAMDGDYTLTITQNGCTSAAGTTNVQINAAPATPNPSNNGPLCAGQTLNLQRKCYGR